jgi:hypothetical protein
MDSPLGIAHDGVGDVVDQRNEDGDIDQIVMKLASEKIQDAVEEQS